MSSNKRKVDKKFAYFLDDLCSHVRVVGGVGDPETLRKMSLEELYKHLYPNNIVIGFKNLRMEEKYQLNNQLRMEELDED